jgi:hypothetical protein
MNKLMPFFAGLLLITNTWASEVDSILRRLETVNEKQERLAKFSEFFMGLPYGINGPLGEGANAPYDQDPLYRFDTFDCTTFVETITALALATTENEFIYHLNQIRYQDGVIDYTLRNHFPSLDWVPNNTANGYLEEINHLVAAPSDIKVARTIVDKPSYYNFLKIGDLRLYDNTTESEKILRVQDWNREGDKFSPQEATIQYIPINTLVDRPALLGKIPHGSIVNFVRPNWDIRHLQGTRMNVSHQGFLFIKNKKLILRHASSGDKFVVEEPFINYLKRFYNHATLKGIHLMRVR